MDKEIVSSAPEEQHSDPLLSIANSDVQLSKTLRKQRQSMPARQKTIRQSSKDQLQENPSGKDVATEKKQAEKLTCTSDYVVAN